MLFNSFEFIFFLAAVVVAYYALPARFRRPLLLVASYAFYMSWNVAYGLLLFGVSLLSYLAGRLIGKWPGRARAVLWLGLAGHLLVLFVFKYLGFFSANLRWLLGGVDLAWRPPSLELLVPVGISFYVFQSMSYVVDVYRRQTPVEPDLWAHVLYISFFPHLVAGPIMRTGELSPQLKQDHDFEFRNLKDGAVLIASGLFKKVVLADTLAVLVASAFSGGGPRGGLGLFLGAVMARYMIFCDIAGYTDIALGSARAFGIVLSKNFARPFAAKNISEYWQRWHMTLSGWFRDYVFYSLAAGPLARFGVSGLVFATFFLLGLWHGASWNYVVWGCVNGAMMIVFLLAKGWREKLPPMPRVRAAFTFLALVCLPTVFVATKSISQAGSVFARIFGVASDGTRWFDVSWLCDRRNAIFFVSCLAFVAGLEIVQKLQDRGPFLARVARWPLAARVGIYALLLAAGVAGAAVVLMRQQNNDFIYVQF